MNKPKLKTEDIPTWLLFGISPIGKKWGEDEQLLAERILRKLKDKAEFNHWDIEKIISVNKHDNAYGYYPKL